MRDSVSVCLFRMPIGVTTSNLHTVSVFTHVGRERPFRHEQFKRSHQLNHSSITEPEIDETLASVAFYTQTPELHVCHAMAARTERGMECEVTRESEE